MKPRQYNRREFVTTVGQALGTSALLMSPATAFSAHRPAAPFTVGGVIDIILKEIPGAPFAETVDTLKSGSREQPVKGIVSTMFATIPVIEKTAALGANFIIAHEPTFYNHRDDVEWLANDDVYAFKKELLNKHGIAVWRFHDYWHTHKPDGIITGVLKKLEWSSYADAENLQVISLPSAPLKKIAEHCKKKLGIEKVRVMGDLAQDCKRVLLLPGASGGMNHISRVRQIKPDVLIVGELSEWETSEYIRDAEAMGRKVSLIVLGHAVSEEPGMEWLVSWLQPRVPGIGVTHIKAGNPFTFL
jgi:putative NIF3 family GTP cyclohydrolase 1 type 2